MNDMLLRNVTHEGLVHRVTLRRPGPDETYIEYYACGTIFRAFSSVRHETDDEVTCIGCIADGV